MKRQERRTITGKQLLVILVTLLLSILIGLAVGAMIADASGGERVYLPLVISQRGRLVPPVVIVPTPWLGYPPLP